MSRENAAVLNLPIFLDPRPFAVGLRREDLCVTARAFLSAL